MKQTKHCHQRQATIFLLLAFIALCLLPVNATAGVFQTMGEPNSDEGVAIVNQTEDGYRIIANRYETDPSSYTIRVLQMDRSGAVIDSKNYSSTEQLVATNAANTSDGGFVLIGYYPQFENNKSFIVKSDSNGVPVWARLLEAGSQLTGMRIVQTNDGGYFASHILTNGSTDEILVTRLDMTGNTVWGLSISDSVLDYQSWMLAPTTDDGFVVAGVLRRGPGIDYNELAIFKITAAGAIDWYHQVSFPGEHFEQGAVIQTSDGGYLVSGGINAIPLKGVLVKFTDSGQLDWAKYIESTGDPVTFTDLHTTVDKGYIVTGWSFIEAANATDVLLAKMTAAGEPLWARKAGTVNASAWEYGFHVQESLTGGYLVAGMIHDRVVSPGERDLVLLATDPLGYISGCDRITALTLTPADITSSISVNQRTIIQDSPSIVNTDITSSIMTNPSSISTSVHCQSVSDVPALGVLGIAVLLITLGLVLGVMSRRV